MLAVYPSGKIAGVWGPCPGSVNDATILNSILKQLMWSHFRQNDAFIVDRGFRDSVEQIEKLRFIAKIPAFAEKNKSLSTEQANYSRLITKTRYIVEVVNGRINNNNVYFANTIRASTLDTVFDDFKIASAIYHLSFTPIQNNFLDILIAERMN